MKTRALGATGFRSSEIGFGAWAIGGNFWGGADDSVSRAALLTALDRGVTLLDTALVYGDGRSERLVGEAVRQHGERDRLCIATKVPPKNLRWPATPDTPLAEAFPAAHLRASVERSLRHLRTEPIDLLQLHVWAEQWLDEPEWHETLSALRRQGKIRWLGVSLNDHQPATGVALVRSGLVDAVQVIFNLFDQSPLDQLLPACMEAKVGVLARVPFDEGSLTGKLSPTTSFAPGDFRARYFRKERLNQTVERVDKLRAALAPYDGDLARAALRFCLSHPAVSSVIPGTRTSAQAVANTAASEVGPLPPELLATLAAHRWERNFYA
jgi:aryl-alcohol dehydrogenase-like predicted oxidoreductase